MNVARAAAAICFAFICVCRTDKCVDGVLAVFAEVVADLVLDTFVETLQKAVNAFCLAVGAETA